MLGVPNIKFIHMLINLSKMYNKILCLVREKMFLLIRGVNQQVSLFCNNGTSETASDITFQFNNYLNLKPLHKKS